MIARFYAVAYILGWLYSIHSLWSKINEIWPELVPTTLSGWEGVARIAIMFAVLYLIMFITGIQVMRRAVKKSRELRQRQAA